MKSLLCLAAISILSFNLDANESIAEDFKALKLDCYDFATEASNGEWEDGIINTEAEYYESWYFWYNSCEDIYLPE